MSIHNLCFTVEIRKNVYPCAPQVYYTKVGCKRVYITRTCYPDGLIETIFVYTLSLIRSTLGL